MKCPDCGEKMVRVKKGWECHNPNCEVIRVTINKGYGRREAKVMRKTISIKVI